MSRMLTRRRNRLPCASLAFVAAACAIAALTSCSKHSTAPPAPLPARPFVMGFSGVPPRADFDLLLATIQLWVPRADGAIMSDELPWDSLLAGVRPDSFVMRNQLPLANYYRTRGLKLVVMVDPANGLNRAGEANALVAAGRSITEPAIQQLYRRYAVAIDTLLRPDELGLALETNLIRAIAPTAIYSAVRQMTNDAAGDIRAYDATVPFMVSVQVETAWGRLVGGGGYAGVAQDLVDFPFTQVLGLSSYPYLAGFADPDSLPDDYYARIVSGTSLPVIVTEGGWSSTTVSSTVTSPAMQRRYIIREAQLLDHTHALGWFQLTFTDLDLATWPAGIEPFAYNGLVDIDLHPKPALAPWDSVFTRPRM
jgi:hypothetical protein